MLIKKRPSYFLLHVNLSDNTRKFETQQEYGAVISSWSSGTRVSPVWKALDVAPSSQSKINVANNQYLFFIGPVLPARIVAEVKAIGTSIEGGALEGLWLTLGVFNTAILINKSEAGNEAYLELKSWLSAEAILHEVWHLEDGLIVNEELCSERNGDVSITLEKLASIADLDVKPLMRSTVQEYCALMASAVTRANEVCAITCKELNAVNDTVVEILKAHDDGILNTPAAQSRVLGLNAALSRFASQAFSGTSPICTTECHLWIHSLLGTGSANRALSNLARFVQGVLGEARIPERLLALKDDEDDLPSRHTLLSGVEILELDFFDDGSKHSPPELNDPVNPVVSYFSGRDGFSSHLQTLSAPLTSIAESNSYHSSLLTITHEISHIFIEAILGDIYPDIDDPKAINKSLKMLSPEFEAKNWLEAAQLLLFESLLCMEQAVLGSQLSYSNLTTEQWKEILSGWRKEVKEIMVHTFDFLYFYNDVKLYVNGIWHSWSAIPDIDDRVPDYVLRTLCAISPDLLKLEPDVRAQVAKREFEEVLKELIDSGMAMSELSEKALDYLEKYWETERIDSSIQHNYHERLYLVRLVKIFLFSPKLSAKITGDTRVRGGDKSYEKVSLKCDLDKIENPLRFLMENHKDSVSEAESLWVLQNLAFNLNE